MHVHGNVTVEELFRNDIISRRVYNLCRRVQLLTVTDIVSYYRKYNTFLYIKNCGKLANSQLISLCTKLETESRVENKETGEEKDNLQWPEEKESEQPGEETTRAGLWEKAEIQYEELKSKLSRRARNKLLAFCNGATLYGLLKKLKEKESPVLEQAVNPNSITGAELLSFLSGVKELIPDVPYPKRIRNESTRLLCERLSLFVPCGSSDEMGIFIESHFIDFTTGDFPLLTFAHLFIQNCTGFNDRHKQIFLRVTGWYAYNAGNKIGIVAQEYGYSNAAPITQILSREKIDEKLMHLLKRAIAILQSFGLQVPSSFILQEEDYHLRRYDDLIAETSFTDSFVVPFMAMLNPYYEAISVRVAKEEQWLLLAKPVSEWFYVVSFFYAFHVFLVTRSYEDQTLPLSGILDRFIKRKLLAKEYKHLVRIVASLLQSFYGISPDASGCLRLERTN